MTLTHFIAWEGILTIGYSLKEACEIFFFLKKGPTFVACEQYNFENITKWWCFPSKTCNTPLRRVILNSSDDTLRGIILLLKWRPFYGGRCFNSTTSMFDDVALLTRRQQWHVVWTLFTCHAPSGPRCTRGDVWTVPHVTPWGCMGVHMCSTPCNPLHVSVTLSAALSCRYSSLQRLLASPLQVL
jgi:hypothetical protein